MSNIGTIQVRCFRKKNVTQRIRMRSLKRWFCPDGSYIVPLWSQDSLSMGVVDIQYGTRAGNFLYLRERWPKLHKYFSSIWVRRYNDAGDFDDIHLLHQDKTYAWHDFLYGFDQLILVSKDDAWRPTDIGFVRETPRQWKKSFHGSYRAANARVVWSDGISHPTCTTPTSICAVNDFPRPFPWSHRELLEMMTTDILYMDLYWKGRVVKRISSHQHWGIGAFCCDHWDNVRLPEYQIYWKEHQKKWSLS